MRAGLAGRGARDKDSECVGRAERAMDESPRGQVSLHWSERVGSAQCLEQGMQIGPRSCPART